MIDIDEAGISTTTADRNHGKAVSGERVNEEGNYGHGEKITLLMGVRGEAGPNDRIFEVEKRPGTDVVIFYNFIESIIDAIGHGTPNNWVCFTMDNLAAHKHPFVLQLILTSGHRYAFSAPYYPVDGPIEYVFDTIENGLSACMHEIFDLDGLQEATIETINSIETFFHTSTM